MHFGKHLFASASPVSSRETARAATLLKETIVTKVAEFALLQLGRLRCHKRAKQEKSESSVRSKGKRDGCREAGGVVEGTARRMYKRI